ncbi:MAG: hypothetical protein KGI25_10410, partial [Thaumarchaeota archaeon]|nr:hypothetical protein [Nitrososphaerota archaeon]
EQFNDVLSWAVNLEDEARRQAKRRELGIASTGCYPNPGEIPCAADVARPPGTDSDHRRWYGNLPTSIPRDDPSLPEESYASKILYGVELESIHFQKP